MGLREASKAIGEISPATLSRIEQGNLPDVETYMLLCTWLDVSADFFKPDQPFLESSKEEAEIIGHLRLSKAMPKNVADSLITMIKIAYDTHRENKKAENK